MRRRDRAVLQIAVIAFLIMVFIFVLGNLVFNLENLYLGPEEAPDFVGSGGAAPGAEVATNRTLADAIRFVWYGILGVVVLAIIASIYSFTKSKDKRKWRNLITQLTGFTLICVVLGGVLLSFDALDAAPSEQGNPTLSTIGGGSGNYTGSQNDTIEAPTGMKVVVVFGIFMILFACIVLTIVGARAIIQMRGERYRSAEEQKVREVAETIQQAIDTLQVGTDARSTIIRCYDDLCRVMERHGVFEKEHLTPREFEVLARRSLPISGAHLHRLVLVFEEARYSDHDLSEAASKNALSSLEKVKEDLTKERDQDA
jgi:hypothetical protein